MKMNHVVSIKKDQFGAWYALVLFKDASSEEARFFKFKEKPTLAQVFVESEVYLQNRANQQAVTLAPLTGVVQVELVKISIFKKLWIRLKALFGRR